MADAEKIKALTKEFDDLRKELRELSDDELDDVTGGVMCAICKNEATGAIDEDCRKRFGLQIRNMGL